MRHDHLRESDTVNSVFALVDLVIKGSLIPFLRLFLRLGRSLSHGKRSAPSAGSGVADGPSCASCALPVGDIWVRSTDGQCVACLPGDQMLSYLYQPSAVDSRHSLPLRVGDLRGNSINGVP